MIHAQPNGTDLNDKYTMAAYKFPKPKPSIKKLTKDGAFIIIKYPNIFTIEKRIFTQKFIKKGNMLMVNNISTNESKIIITKVEFGIVTGELLCLIDIKLRNVINHQED
jgi:hypothetical protein